jgi:NAD(P)-dependent dehydrogenase (short-subunit alcohol dehydrogenase family)
VHFNYQDDLMTNEVQRTALVTGASKGLGRALAEALTEHDWRIVVDARDPLDLPTALPDAVVVAGDVTDPRHRQELSAAAESLGRLDLLVNNASTLGVSPLPHLADLPLGALRTVLATNVEAPIALTQLLIRMLRRSAGIVVNISSDAAVEAYEGWGGYGASKAALDHASAILAAEEPTIRVYAVDPGDMRTDMHQSAFPDEDISDRPDARTVTPALLRLIVARPPSGRYRAEQWTPAEVG